MRSSKKIEILQVVLVLRAVSWNNIFFREERNVFFPLFFHYEIIFCCAELFECAFNFKFCWNIFIFLNINTNQTSKERFEFYKKQPLILGAAVERCSWNVSLEVNGQACNFTLRAFLRIMVTSFWTVLKNLLKFLKFAILFRKWQKLLPWN